MVPTRCSWLQSEWPYGLFLLLTRQTGEHVLAYQQLELYVWRLLRRRGRGLVDVFVVDTACSL